MNHHDWPIIVGGVHRSGTSLVRRILDSHSRIHCGPEIKFFKDWYEDYIGDPIKHARFFESARAILPEEELFQIFGEAFIELHRRAARNANKPRWADKCPENALFLSDWEKLLGTNWSFIHVVRNPLDTLASIAEANFRFSIPADLQARIDLYKRYSMAGLAFSRLHPERYYRLVYERLVKAPEAEVERLMHWLGESTEPQQMQFNAVPHQPGLEDPKIRSTERVHPESLNRWKRVLSRKEMRSILEQTSSLWEGLDLEHDFPLTGG